ncbi:MAG TPA: oxidoreductase [Sphaerochaeta sp.]|nr:MAG: oxidoreductase [Spirochaetes bacterium GWC2_52_13]PKL20306.1 MAG: oxidoreductase [Spirochaetae bacterium HGW-Spirochaetae-4]HCG64860.1 oxidoreductase [Sphaerochaeta sp.]HCJ95383.1 oxidoreductase [Sphaerochaeta sp.]HCS35482.1 oxidoreductase [Sphaerochaeta sp.]
MKTVGFGVIGLGMISEVHAKAIGDLNGCRLVAGFDSSEERAVQFGRAYSCRTYTSLDEFLADPDLDIVTVATPSGLHLEGAIAAAEAKKHVIVEKPLEITKQRCNQIIAACAANGVKLAGVFPSRYHEAPKLIKRAIEQGRFGKIVMADAQVKWFRTQAYYDSGAWRGTWKFDGGGALMNQSIHAIDLLQWFMGDVSEVFAFTDTLSHERIEVEDTAVAVLKFANGAMGVIEGTTSAYPGFLKKIEILGTKGSVVMEEESIVAWKFEEELPEDQAIRAKYFHGTSTGGGASDPKAIGHHGHTMLFGSVVDSIRNDAAVEVSGESARNAVEIIEGIYRSAQTGAKVNLPL